MYSAAFARTAYGESDRTQGLPRRVEYRAFAEVTHRLAAAEADPGPGSARLAGALHDNLRLWNTLASDLADPGNALPAALKGRLLGLASFTERQTRAILAGRSKAGILVEINTAIMRGLRGERVEAAEAARA